MATYVYSNCSTLASGSGCYLYTDAYQTTPVSNGKYSDGSTCFTVSGGAGLITAAESCVQYDVYLADKYDCSDCSYIGSSYLIAVTAGTTINYSEYYTPLPGSGQEGVYYYQPYSLSSGAGLICYNTSQPSCALACPVA